MKYKIAIIFLFASSTLFGQNNIQRIDSLLISLYKKGRINGNVLIADKDQIIYSKSFGFANEATKEKLTENSVFDLASVSKQFTALGIMLLKEKGILNLDEPFSTYIPELSSYKGITVKHLLNHTGGLPDYMDIFNKTFDKTKIATNNDIIAHFSKEKPKVLFVPNSRWEYSNTGYALLASIIERVSGLKYRDFMTKHIFKPLEMSNTFVQNGNNPLPNIKNLAYSYAFSDSLKKLVLTDELKEYNDQKMLSGVVGDGGIFSNVIDLLKWDRALYDNRLISTAVKKEMFKPAILANGSTFEYGYGFQLDSSKVFGKIISHTGGWGGYLTLNELHVNSGKTIIILFNHESSEIINKSIRYTLYGLQEPNPTGKKEITLTPEQLNKVVGAYKIQEGMEFFITLKGGVPYASMTNQTPLRIYPVSDTLFFLKEFDATILFEKDEKRNIYKLTFSQGKGKMEAKRIK
ncbi:serine hydrolase [Pedobacter sp. Hv1]|uniref:serine hydrolase domain-containing protein n=1 Tax=Pedobacter sp. Hv1 TaxID=1740090 RepID=UPI0006D8A587|nr:serine hydrolase domain-containing protein [Pedobacter sp. Hv1]KQB99492.1 serine hydrolase [Pedobacter sp. Hv1]